MMWPDCPARASTARIGDAAAIVVRFAPRHNGAAPGRYTSQSDHGSHKKSPAAFATGPVQAKRVMRFELTTFTLASPPLIVPKSLVFPGVFATLSRFYCLCNTVQQTLFLTTSVR